MADRTLTINHADGGSETYTINRDKFAGVRNMTVDGANVSVDHTAVPKEQSKETTFGGSQSITVKRDIEPLLSKVVGGAAAAYSLRDLNDKAGNNKVVRVRRASDNHERDFLAKEVSNGTLQNWVNTQVVAPLDIKALTSTGRDGAYQIAKAAYSLRSLGTRQATLAATGDTVARADGKFVVQVRRSADDALKSFTADEVTDGTLVDFVSFSVGTAVNGTGGYNHYTLTNASNTGFSADNGDGGASMAGFPYSFTNGDEITVQFTVSNFNNTGGDPHLMGTDSTGTGSQKTNYEFITANGTYTKTLTATADGTHLMFRHFGTGSYTISDFQVPSPTVTKDGFVKTWYDQSVTNEAGDTATGNHAVQATAASQPKIVSAGALNTSGGLEFDGSNDFFSLTSDISFENKAGCVFSVQDGQDSSNDLTLGNSSSNRGIGFRNIQTKWYYTTGAIDIDNSSSTSGLTLFTALHDGTTNDPNVKAFVNSSLIVDGIPDANQGEANVSTVANQIAARRDLSFIEGTVKEIVIYDTNQTDNRTAIEANIGEAYSITGIPAYDDEVDGFVETWYDQSGNNRPLIQTTASEQPLIVEAGVFLNGVKSNQATSNDTMQNLQVSTDGTNANFGTDDWASGASSKLGAVYVGTVPTDSVVSPTARAVIWGGGRGVGTFQLGGVSLQVVKAGTDGWRIMNERQGLSPSTMENVTSLNTDADVVLYGTTDNREFTINVNGSGDTETASADLDVREGQALSLFGAYNGSDGSYYQRSAGGVCKECYLYAGDPVANIPALATSINSHYSIY